MEEKKTLKDCLPLEYMNEFQDSPLHKYDDVLVTREHSAGSNDNYLPWPGTHRNVMNWWELENGLCVGWNENPSVGWNFVSVKTPSWLARYGMRTLDRSFSRYKNEMKAPSKLDFTLVYGYSRGQALFSRPKSEITAAFLEQFQGPVIREEILDDAAYADARKKYHEEDDRLFGEFKLDLFSEYGVENHPKREKAFGIAWEHGHSSGYNDVVGYFEELVDLIFD